MKNEHHHSKKEFQLERLVLFSDAVFAIAITLLIIDMKVPELKGIAPTEQQFLNELFSIIPKFVGFVLSFFIIGLYWVIHHKMFGFIINYSNKLIWLNLLFLFSIVLMPFSTAVYSAYSSVKYINLITPYIIYVFNICLTGILNYLLWSYIGNPKNHMAEGFPTTNFIKNAKIRSLLLPSVFIVSLLVGIFINPIIGRMMLFLIPVVMRLVRNRNPKQLASKKRVESL